MGVFTKRHKGTYGCYVVAAGTYCSLGKVSEDKSLSGHSEGLVSIDKSSQDDSHGLNLLARGCVTVDGLSQASLATCSPIYPTADILVWLVSLYYGTLYLDTFNSTGRS